MLIMGSMLQKRKKRGGSRAFQLGRCNSMTRDYPTLSRPWFLPE
jgi:hypothetical protein